MTDREILIAGAIAYWCEGAKSKPHRHVERVVFINSDPALIGFFLRFLDTAGIPRDDLIFRVYIHETADVEAAQRFWLDLTRSAAQPVPEAGAQAPQPEDRAEERRRGLPRLPRIEVRRSSELYRRIEGWAAGAMAGQCLAPGSA